MPLRQLSASRGHLILFTSRRARNYFFSVLRSYDLSVFFFFPFLALIFPLLYRAPRNTSNLEIRSAVNPVPTSRSSPPSQHRIVEPTVGLLVVRYWGACLPLIQARCLRSRV